MNIVGLIPARGGSKRIPGKNIRSFFGHPLLAYAIRSALDSGIFSDVIVSTDDFQTELIAQQYGASTRFVGPPCHTDMACDYLWITHALTLHRRPDAFAILRPSSPFRTAETIRRGFEQFRKSEVHSIRAVEPVKQHPGKMWDWAGPGYPMTPIFNGTRSDGTPWHSSPTQTLPTFYIQNACLEIAWSYVLTSFGTISGRKIAPFFTHGHEGFDLNTEDDWREAERLVCYGGVTLPTIPVATAEGTVEESPHADPDRAVHRGSGV